MCPTHSSLPHSGHAAGSAIEKGGICICYLYYGILQERLFTGEERLGATFVLLTQCITNTVVAFIWHAIQDIFLQQNQQTPSSNIVGNRPLPQITLWTTSLCYVTAMTCSNEAIAYVSYPVAVLAKSCKLIPTMLVGQFVEKRLYSTMEWMAALCISAGIVLFNVNRMQQQLRHDILHDGSAAQYGTILLLISLSMDGLLSSCQNLLKNCGDRYQPPNAMETMLYVNGYAAVLLIPLSMYSQQWEVGIDSLFRQHGPMASNIAILNATAAIGQIFVFLTITWFSPIITTTITTTRKFFTILLSVWTFGHAFNASQWTAIGLVFAGLFLVIYVQRQKSRVDTAPAKSKHS
jgi:UDP-galactose transporter B1